MADPSIVRLYKTSSTSLTDIYTCSIPYGPVAEEWYPIAQGHKEVHHKKDL